MTSAQVTPRAGQRQTDEPSDAELIVAARTDPEAFGLLYDRYEQSVLAYFVKRTACPHTAADLTAETFAGALVGIEQFDPELGSISQWLFGIARHQLAHFLRHREVEDHARRRLGLSPMVLSEEAFERIDALSDFEPLRSEIWRFVDDLPDSQAEAVRLRIALDLPYEDVATQLNCTINAARVRVARGLAALRTLVQTPGGIA